MNWDAVGAMAESFWKQLENQSDERLDIGS